MTRCRRRPARSPPRTPSADEDVAGFRRRRPRATAPAVATRSEAGAYRGPVAAATMRLSTETRPLEERDTYGRAFLQVMQPLAHTTTTSPRFVLAARFAGWPPACWASTGVRLYHDQALFKEPGGGYTPWHQDAMYWPLDGRRCLTMWMPLVDITPSMGGLCFATRQPRRRRRSSDVHISDASEEHFDRLLAERRCPLRRAGARCAPATRPSTRGWTVHKALPNALGATREVMTVIWFADGLPGAASRPTRPRRTTSPPGCPVWPRRPRRRHRRTPLWRHDVRGGGRGTSGRGTSGRGTSGPGGDQSDSARALSPAASIAR